MSLLKGYTLIEMVVVIGVIGLMSLGAVASYNKYNDRVKVEQGARLIAAQLRGIQKDVTTGTSSCGTVRFDGVEVSVADGGKSVFVKDVCNGVVSGGAPRVTFPTPPFGADLTITTPFTPFWILAVSGGSNSTVNMTISRTPVASEQTVAYVVTMTMAGGISVAQKQ